MNLNDQQQQAVQSQSPDTLVLACPGAGKTTVIAARLQRQRNLHPSTTLAAITFTNAAARELRQRVSLEAPADLRRIFIGTIHAYALHLLRGHWAPLMASPQPLMVMSETLQARTLATACEDLNYKGTKKAVQEALAKEVLFATQEPVLTDTWREPPSLADLVAKRYYLICRANGLVSYDDLLKLAAQAARLARAGGCPAVTEELLVDEFQDVNGYTAQFIAEIPTRRRFLVGDPDQAIYSFLGGTNHHILKAAASPAWRTIKLEQTYRCAAAIVRGANRLIRHNTERLERAMIEPAAEGALAGFWFDTEADEAAWLTERLEELLETTPPPSIAVLARSNFIASQLAATFRAAGLPVCEYSSGALPEDWPLAQALVAALANQKNDYLVHDLVIRKFGPAEGNRVRDTAAAAGQPITTRWPDILPEGKTVADHRTHILNFMTNSEAGEDTLALIAKAMANVGEQATMDELALAMADPALARDPSLVVSGLQVSTLHAAKGREFDHVFIAACEEKVIPSPRAEIQEERRLFYVGITRARSRCWLSWTYQRTLNKWSKGPEATGPSRFIKEALDGE